LINFLPENPGRKMGLRVAVSYIIREIIKDRRDLVE
jgi:hypothetical protein